MYAPHLSVFLHLKSMLLLYATCGMQEAAFRFGPTQPVDHWKLLFGRQQGRHRLRPPFN